MKITNVEIWNPDLMPYIGTICIQDDLISLEDIDYKPSIDGSGLIAMPGFVDLHIHGAAGSDMMDATIDAVETIANAVLKEGVTAFLCTTMTQSNEAIEAAIQQFKTKTSHLKNIVGIHLEGPFVNAKRAGAQPVEYIQPPNVELFKQWHQLSEESIKLVTVAPELIQDDFIETLANLNINVSAGHTDATSEQLRAAQQQGLRSITHLYNQMSPFHHREIGAIGEALSNDELYCELIADFIHCSEEAAKFALKCKGDDKLLLITDAMRAKGLSSGTYDLGGQAVIVGNDARLADGTLAGSILKMNDAVKNMAKFCKPDQLVKMSSTNANQLLNRQQYGAIKEGYIADIVILDRSFEVQYTILNGQIVYSKE